MDDDGLGALLGVACAGAGTRFLRGLLFEVEPIDPVIIGGATVLLLIAAALAAYTPMRRAARAARACATSATERASIWSSGRWPLSEVDNEANVSAAATARAQDDLARELPVSRQAVQKHLGALADAGLVATRRSGREVLYRPTPAPMSEALAWMAEVGGQWDDRLAALERQLSRGRAARA